MNKYLIRVYPNDDIYIKRMTNIFKETSTFKFTSKYHPVLILPKKINNLVSSSPNIIFSSELINTFKEK